MITVVLLFKMCIWMSVSKKILPFALFPSTVNGQKNSLVCVYAVLYKITTTVH
jgi:hypothetical protein